MALDKDSFSELVTLRVRGVLARAFAVRNVAPTDEQWAMLRGEELITMRDIGEIGHDLKVDFEVVLSPREIEDP